MLEALSSECRTGWPLERLNDQCRGMPTVAKWRCKETGMERASPQSRIPMEYGGPVSVESPVEGTSEPITLVIITKAINKMASPKHLGHEMLKPVGELV